jgi:hypothetical protein
MAILNEPSGQTRPHCRAGSTRPCPAKSIEAEERFGRDAKNQPFATIKQIRPWNPADRAR